MDTNNDLLTLSELIEQANALLERVPALASTSPIEERTLRYWVQEGLLPRLGTRGPGSHYPQSFAYRLVFIRMLQKLQALTLVHIRDVLARVEERTVKRVVEGKEGMRVSTKFDADEIGKHRARGEEVLMLEPGLGAESASAKDYLGSVSGQFRSTPAKSARSPVSASAPGWLVAWQGDDVEIRVRRPVSTTLRERMRLAGELLQSMFEEKKP
jgi:DNA-binding transcriptional MerR regulator